MNDLKKKELDSCFFVKTILMLLIILGHSIAFWSGNWISVLDVKIDSAVLQYIYKWLSSFHVYTFALVSGYIFAYKRSAGSYDRFIPFIQNKAKRLLIPYIFVASIWVVPITSAVFRLSITDLIKKYVLCIGPSQLWFLWMLFWVFAFSWPLYRIFSEKKLLGGIIVILFYGLGLTGEMFLPDVFCIWTACKYMPLFFIGIIIRLLSPEQNKTARIFYRIPWWCFLLLDLILFSAVQFIPGEGTFFKLLQTGLYFLLHCVGAVAAFRSLQALAGVVHWKKNKGFGLFTKYSMPMYLFHQQIIYLPLFLLNGLLHPFLHSAINFAIAMAGAFLISYILMHFKGTRFLLGEK